MILRPPGVAEQLLARALRVSPYRDDILGDLHESYAAVVAAHSTVHAMLVLGARDSTGGALDSAPLPVPCLPSNL